MFTDEFHDPAMYQHKSCISDDLATLTNSLQATIAIMPFLHDAAC